MSSDEWAWGTGAALCFASTVLSPLGYVLQKRATAPPTTAAASDASPAHSTEWLLGCALVLLAVLLSLASSAFTAQSILAPLSSFSLIVNMAASALLLGERVTRVDVLSCLLIVAGSVLSVVFGDHTDPAFTNSGLQSTFLTLDALLYAGLSTTFCLGVYAALRYQSSAARAQPERRQLRGRQAMLQALLYCVLAGALGAQSDLFGKMVVELIRTSAQGEQQLTEVGPYIYLTATAAFALAQIHFLSQALILFDALYCLPLYECVEILTSTVGGAVVFGELATFTSLQLGAFALGLASLLLGVAIMALRDANTVSDASSISSGPSQAPRGSVHSAATMLAQLVARRWKVTRAKEEDDEEQEARRARSKSMSEVELSEGLSRAQRERRSLGRLGARAVDLQAKGQLRLPQQVELSVMKLSQHRPTSPSLLHATPISHSRRKQLSARSHSLPSSAFTSVDNDPIMAGSLRSAASSASPPSGRWAEVSESSASVSLVSPPSHHRHRVTVSRSALEEAGETSALFEERERPLSVLREEPNDSGSVSLRQPPVRSLVHQSVSQSAPPVLRVIRISRVRRSEHQSS